MYLIAPSICQNTAQFGIRHNNNNNNNKKKKNNNNNFYTHRTRCSR